MSNHILTLAWQTSGLSPTKKCVLARLADFANEKGEAWPGHERLAADCGITPRTVQTAIKELQSEGHLTVREESKCASKEEARFTYLVHPQISGGTGNSQQEHRKTATKAPENGDTPIITSTGTSMNRGAPKVPAVDRITYEKSLDRVYAELAQLADADLPGPKARRIELKLEKQRLLDLLGIKA